MTAGRQQQILIRVGDRAQALGQEMLSRHLAHRGEQTRVVDLMGPQLVSHHVQPGAGVVHRQGPLAVAAIRC
jgi:hypothetical protein